jgi:Zn-finger nucleic acid-binding protein
MEPVTFNDIEVDRCTSCGGLWFDILEAERLRDVRGSGAIDTGDAEAAKGRNEMGRFKCPRDSGTMIRMVVPDQPHIWYESCATCHGTYFDAGEFKDFRAETFVDTVRALFSKERK